MSDSTALLRVSVSTALGAYPLENALVTVSTVADSDSPSTLLYSVQTDKNGLTPPLSLETPQRTKSLSPGLPVPYATYTVQVFCEGYVSQTALHVSMFADIPAVLPVPLVPITENPPSPDGTLTSTGSTQALYHEEE